MMARREAALLLIDFQVGPLWEADDLRRDVIHLATAARMLGVPTIVTTSACEARGPVIPELFDASPEARVIPRSVPNALEDAGVRCALDSMNRNWLVIAGRPVETAVAEAAVDAARAGWTVYVPLDACGYANRGAATTAILEMDRAGVVVTCCAALVIDLAAGKSDVAACDALALALRHPLTEPLIPELVR